MLIITYVFSQRIYGFYQQCKRRILSAVVKMTIEIGVVMLSAVKHPGLCVLISWSRLSPLRVCFAILPLVVRMTIRTSVVMLSAAKHFDLSVMNFLARIPTPSGVLCDPPFGRQNDNKNQRCHAEHSEASRLTAHDILVEIISAYSRHDDIKKRAGFSCSLCKRVFFYSSNTFLSAFFWSSSRVSISSIIGPSYFLPRSSVKWPHFAARSSTQGAIFSSSAAL